MCSFYCIYRTKYQNKMNTKFYIAHVQYGCLQDHITHIYICVRAHMHRFFHIRQWRHILCNRKYFSAPWWSSSVTANVSLALSTQSHSQMWYTNIVRQLTLQLPWQHRAAAQALKASCIISWCVDTLAFFSYSLRIRCF